MPQFKIEGASQLSNLLTQSPAASLVQFQPLTENFVAYGALTSETSTFILEFTDGVATMLEFVPGKLQALKVFELDTKTFQNVTDFITVLVNYLLKLANGRPIETT